MPRTRRLPDSSPIELPESSALEVPMTRSRASKRNASQAALPTPRTRTRTRRLRDSSPVALPSSSSLEAPMTRSRASKRNASVAALLTPPRTNKKRKVRSPSSSPPPALLNEKKRKVRSPSSSPPPSPALLSKKKQCTGLISPPPSRRQTRRSEAPVTPPPRSLRPLPALSLHPLLERDSPDNPFLVHSTPGSEVGSSPPLPATPLPHVEKPTIAYVFRGTRTYFRNPLYKDPDDPSAEEEEAKSLLPESHPDFSPSTTCPPKLLWPEARTHDHARRPRRKAREGSPIGDRANTTRLLRTPTRAQDTPRLPPKDRSNPIQRAIGPERRDPDDVFS